MDLQAAVAIAKQYVEDVFAIEAPRDLRLESFLYDDHLMVWSLTIGFTCTPRQQETRLCKLVRVSEANQAVLSIKDP
jgi:hypothetical protein